MWLGATRTHLSLYPLLLFRSVTKRSPGILNHSRLASPWPHFSSSEPLEHFWNQGSASKIISVLNLFCESSFHFSCLTKAWLSPHGVTPSGGPSDVAVFFPTFLVERNEWWVGQFPCSFWPLPYLSSTLLFPKNTQFLLPCHQTTVSSTAPFVATICCPIHPFG